jgi:hypothetical protein
MPWAFARLGYQTLPSSDDRREVDVVPVDRWLRGYADHSGVEPCTQVQADRVGVARNKGRRHLVQLLGSECDVDHQIRVDVELLVVLLERLHNLVSSGVGEDGV